MAPESFRPETSELLKQETPEQKALQAKLELRDETRQDIADLRLETSEEPTYVPMLNQSPDAVETATTVNLATLSARTESKSMPPRYQDTIGALATTMRRAEA